MKHISEEDRGVLRKVVEHVVLDSGTLREIAKYGVNTIYKRMIMEILVDMRRTDLYDDALQRIEDHCEDEYHGFE